MIGESWGDFGAIRKYRDNFKLWIAFQRWNEGLSWNKNLK